MVTPDNFFKAIFSLIDRTLLIILAIVVFVFFLGFAIGHCADIPKTVQPDKSTDLKKMAPEDKGTFVVAPNRGKDGSWEFYIWKLEKGRLENLKIYKIEPLDKGD